MADNAHTEPPLTEGDWIRLARLVAGEGDAAERAATEAWVAADAARGTVLGELRSAWARGGAVPRRPVNVDAAWTTMQRKMAGAHATARARPTVWRSPALAMAASILVLLGGVLMVKELREGAPTSLAAAQAFATAPGERRTITLADSTEVVLGVASRIEVAAGYGSPNREMTLVGEALFRVRHDAARPFRVRTGNAITEDLGTEFTVRSYAGEAVEVVVREGSVALRAMAGADSAVIRAGQTGVLAAGRAPTVGATVDPAAEIAWTRGEIVFNGTPLRDVTRELERWYDVEFAPADSSLSARRLTTSFAGDSLGDVLRVIELTFGVRVVRDGRTILLQRP